MKHLVEQPHILMSVQNPFHPVSSELSHEDATGILSGNGKYNNVYSAKGKYGNSEDTIFISNPNEAQTALAHKIAEDTGQDSLIESDGHSHKMIATNGPDKGSVTYGKGTTWHEQEPEDYYTTLPTGEHFTHNFDEANQDVQKSEGLEKSKNVREQRAKVFGTDPNAPRISNKRMKMMQAIQGYAQKKYGLPMTTGSGKRTMSGELRDEKGIEQQPFDVFTPEGHAEERARQAKVKQLGLKRVDPKPDWRSGNIETQPSPDAAVHELAHIDLAPEGMTLPEFQVEMDRRHGQNQKDFGYMQNKRTSYEIQPMALENPIRRELGLPANRATKPVKQNEPVLDMPSEKRFVEGKDSKGRTVFYDRQSRLMVPETKERLTQVREGSLKFDPKAGWQPSSDVNALINLRGRGMGEEAQRRAKQKFSPSTQFPQQSSAPSIDDLLSHQGSVDELKQKIKQYAESQPKKLASSEEMSKSEQLRKRCWEGYRPVPGKKPYSKGSCAPIKKNHINKNESNFSRIKIKPQTQFEYLGRQSILQNGNFTLPEQQEILLNQGDRSTLAENPNLHPSLHEKLANDEDSDVRSTMAERSDLHPSLHEKLANDENWKVRSTIAKNPNLHPSLHEKLANDVSDNVRSTIAKNPNLHPSLHEKLANDENWKVRSTIAKNPNLHPSLHEKLANDVSDNVRSTIAKNPNLHPSLHEKLANDVSDNVRSTMAERPDLHPQLHEKLVNDENWKVRSTIAKNPNLHASLHEKLANDKDSFVRSAMAENPSIHPSAIDILAQDENPDVLKDLLNNSSLDRNTKDIVDDRREDLVSRRAHEDMMYDLQSTGYFDKSESAHQPLVGKSEPEAGEHPFLGHVTKKYGYHDEHPVKKFLKEWIDTTQEHPFVSHRIHGFENPEDPENPNFAFSDLYPDHYNPQTTVSIDWLQSHKKGSGAGSQALKEITDLADKHGVNLSLIAGAGPGAKIKTTAPSRLKRFYGRHGFKSESSKGSYMIRPANAGQITKSDDYIFHPEDEDAIHELFTDPSEKLEMAEKPFHGYNKEKHSRTGGLSDKYREKYNRETGSNLKRPVTGKVKAGSKAAGRRKSFCARMSGVKGPTSKDGKLTPKGAALKRWRCSKSEELEKGTRSKRFPFNPLKDINSDNSEKVYNFQEYNADNDPDDLWETRNAIKPDHGNMRQRFLLALHPKTKVRKAKDGKREFLLHRGVDRDAEFGEYSGNKIDEKGVSHSQNSSWTPNIGIARGRRATNQDENLISAWIHEDKIVTVPKQYGKLDRWGEGQGKNDFANEHEVIVAPHTSELHQSMTTKLAASELEKAKLEHYSSQQGLKTIDPKFKGRGVDIRTKGRDTEHPHSFFYRAGTLPEDVVASGAKSKYTVEIPDEMPLYDLATDNQGHIASAIEQNQGALNMDMVHQNLKDAGYQGFYNSAHPQLSNVVALYHEQPVSEEHEVQKQEGTDCDDHLDPLKKPYASESQRRWAHTPAGKKALGGEKAVAHWDTASRGKDLPEKVKKKDFNSNNLEKVNRAEVAQSHILMFPVSINGKHRDEHEDIPDYHVTLKWMGNTPHKSPEEIQDIVNKYGLIPPESFGIHPHIFNTPNGPAHVLLLSGKLDTLHNAKKEIDIGNPDRYPSYLPHITVSKTIHDAVKEHGLTPKDLNIQVHPLEYRVGEQTIKRYE